MKYPTCQAAADDPKNGMASMVDIAFLLLIFFLVATTIVPAERDLALGLGVPGGRSETAMSPVVIEITAEGAVFWGWGAEAMEVAMAGDDRELPELVEMLQSAVVTAGPAELEVLLKTSDEVSQQRFTDVLNAFAGCGISQVGMVE